MNIKKGDPVIVKHLSLPPFTVIPSVIPVHGEHRQCRAAASGGWYVQASKHCSPEGASTTSTYFTKNTVITLPQEIQGEELNLHPYHYHLHYHLPPRETKATRALCRHVIPFWNHDDPRIENLSFSVGARGPISIHRRTIQLWVGGEVHTKVQANQL